MDSGPKDRKACKERDFSPNIILCGVIFKSVHGFSHPAAVKLAVMGLFCYKGATASPSFAFCKVKINPVM